MSRRFSTVHDGRRIEVEPVGGWSGTTVRLLVDGAEIARAKGGKRVVVREAELEVRAWPAWHGERLKRAELHVDGDTTGAGIPLDPPAGTFAARREAFARRHPAIDAARHPATAVAKVLFGLLGISLAIRLLPDLSIDLPSIDLPLPSIHLPSIDLPDLPSIDFPDLPAWVAAVVESAKYWGPILVALAYGATEFRRRRRQREALLARERRDQEPPEGSGDLEATSENGMRAPPAGRGLTALGRPPDG
jgi:hypothetical protein